MILVAQEAEYLVRPALNPILSDSFADLTGISNGMLARVLFQLRAFFVSFR